MIYPFIPCPLLFADFKYAGTQNGGECYCDNAKYEVWGRRPESDCAAECKTNRLQTCGGRWRNSVFKV